MVSRTAPADRSPPSASSRVEMHLNSILMHAIEGRASDIHLEPFEQGIRVRERRDGRLYDAPSPPMDCAEGVVSRLKILAKLDIAERRLPQDGQCTHPTSASNPAVDLRVSTLPTTHGEKVVIRILDGANMPLDLTQLGFTEPQLEMLHQTLTQSQGLILNSGPTGSGKTLTLYSCLNHLMATHLNVSTIEDPCEIELVGANQVSIHDRIGLTFDSALRALMRQDPDVIMIGEIRDNSTAEMAIKAAQTGHLVLSSIHTNDAPSTLARLIYMGVPGFHVGSSLTLVCAQRLLRRLCLHCRTRTSPPTQVQDQFPHENWHSPQGCDRCLGGYSGRIGVFEMMPITAELHEALLLRPDVLRFTDIARRQGTLSLRDAGLALAAEGLTS
ncbi:MAG: type pilus assembly ATPase PilB, partial [Pseudomonadota bacterium]